MVVRRCPAVVADNDVVHLVVIDRHIKVPHEVARRFPVRKDGVEFMVTAVQPCVASASELMWRPVDGHSDEAVAVVVQECRHAFPVAKSAMKTSTSAPSQLHRFVEHDGDPIGAEEEVLVLGHVFHATQRGNLVMHGSEGDQIPLVDVDMVQEGQDSIAHHRALYIEFACVLCREQNQRRWRWLQTVKPA